MSVLLPGDLSDTHALIRDRIDYGVSMLSAGRIIAIPRVALMNLIDQHPTIAKALWLSTLIDEAILREWLTNIGGRDALSRLAHFVCELAQRLDNVGLLTATGFDMPMNQVALAEALGLTAIHVNRMLRRLREDNILVIRHGRATISDLSKLQKLGNFDPGYLCMRPPSNSSAVRSFALKHLSHYPAQL